MVDRQGTFGCGKATGTYLAATALAGEVKEISISDREGRSRGGSSLEGMVNDLSVRANGRRVGD